MREGGQGSRQWFPQREVRLPEEKRVRGASSVECADHLRNRLSRVWQLGKVKVSIDQQRQHGSLVAGKSWGRAGLDWTRLTSQSSLERPTRKKSAAAIGVGGTRIAESPPVSGPQPDEKR